MRVLVTGSRDWPNPQTVYMALQGLYQEHGGPLVVVHGACPSGADRAAADWCLESRCGREERHPAQWEKWGRAAGPARNAEMVSLGADICLAFIRGDSRGASHCARLAEEAGIDTRIWRM